MTMFYFSSWIGSGMVRSSGLLERPKVSEVNNKQPKPTPIAFLCHSTLESLHDALKFYVASRSQWKFCIVAKENRANSRKRCRQPAVRFWPTGPQTVPPPAPRCSFLSKKHVKYIQWFRVTTHGAISMICGLLDARMVSHVVKRVAVGKLRGNLAILVLYFCQMNVDDILSEAQTEKRRAYQPYTPYLPNYKTWMYFDQMIL